MLIPIALFAACAASAPATPPSPAGRAANSGTPLSHNPSALATKVRTASLFKNGLAFVRREATVPGGARDALIEPLPVPVQGTFWLAADPARIEIVSAVARRSELRERVPAVRVEDLLRANIGRNVTLFVGEKDILSGTLVAMPEPNLGLGESNLHGFPTPAPGSLILLDTGTGITGLAPGDVKRVAFGAGDVAREFERRREASSLTLSVASRGSGTAPLSIYYLERGLTWVPSYAIDISDRETALLTSKAEVIDEAEDLEGATLQFVTGFPNLQFAHVIDPIAMRGDMDAFFSALGQTPSARAPIVMQQRVLANMAYGGSEGATFPVSGAPSEGSAVEDLFFYEHKDTTLKRGERGLYPLFSLRVPYEHLYEWKIADTIETQPEVRGDRPPEEEIWHSIRLSNDSALPWTTAPAMTMKDGNLLGQDTLNYAAVGAKTTVRITRAVDVQGDTNEYETARIRNAANFYGSSYDKVSVHGVLHVVNHKREAVRLEITKKLQGEVAQNPDGAKVVVVAEGLRRVNPNARLTWSVLLEAGKTADINYEYTLFVRP